MTSHQPFGPFIGHNWSPYIHISLSGVVQADAVRPEHGFRGHGAFHSRTESQQRRGRITRQSRSKETARKQVRGRLAEEGLKRCQCRLLADILTEIY